LRGRNGDGDQCGRLLGRCDSSVQGLWAKVISVGPLIRETGEGPAVGADAALDSRRTAIPAAVRDLTNGLGVQCVIDGVGDAETMKTGIESLCHGGRLVILGYTQDRFALDPRKTAVQELEILGTRSGGRDDTAESIRLVESDTWVPVVTDFFEIEQVEEAHALIRQGKNLGRIVLTFKE